MQILVAILSVALALVGILWGRSRYENGKLKHNLATAVLDKELKDVKLTEEIARNKFSASLDAYRKWKSGR